MSPRSLLFVPGDRPERMRKAAASGADAIILDLEDSVTAGNKAHARKAIADFLADNLAPTTSVMVRINPLDTPDCVADLDLIARHRIMALMLPKSAGASSILEVAARLHTPPPILPIAAETAESLFALGTYGAVKDHLFGITWGAEDMATAIGASSSRHIDGSLLSPLETARNLMLFAARAAGVPAIETVFADVKNPDGLNIVARRAASEGFYGMMAIHPSQVPIINEAFSPTAEQIEEAMEIVRLFNDNPDAGVLTRNGRMLDKPHLLQARTIIERARRA